MLLSHTATAYSHTNVVFMKVEEGGGGGGVVHDEEWIITVYL